MTRILSFAAAFAALSIPALAASLTMDAIAPTLGGDTVVKRMVIKIDDLNPADAKDAAVLYERLDKAATTLCSSNPGGNSALIADAVAACRKKALKRIVGQVDTPALDAVAAGK
jgi:UrcA family protein